MSNFGFRRFLSLVLGVCLALSLTACAGAQPTGQPDAQPDPAPAEPSADVQQPKEPVDYAASLHFNINSETAKAEVTVKTYVDGDTTHFHVPEGVDPSGVLKARYLAIDTPESTGKIEEYGKKASNFTKSKLESAVSIYVESDNGSWNYDSTGTRRLVWVWYLPEGETEYRNLNVEILQSGLAIASSAANNRYGSTCTAALAQAKEQKLNVFSGEKDPDFYYGDAVELTLRQLRCHIAEYDGIKVAFEGIVTCHDGSSSAYLESYDEESGLYYGMAVYYGFNLPGEGLAVLSVGNLARVVGTVQYYEAGDTYQVSGLSYRVMKPDDPGNLKKISGGHTPAFTLTEADTFANAAVCPDEESGEVYPYAALTLDTSISMTDLAVQSVYTTDNASSGSNGAMTLTCLAPDGTEIQVRTAVLRDDSGRLLAADDLLGKTIDVRGVVGSYDGAYQIRVFSLDNLTIH